MTAPIFGEERFNHVFEIAFEVDSEKDSPDIPAGEIRQALEARLKRLDAVGDAELLEAVGDPVETWVNGVCVLQAN